MRSSGGIGIPGNIGLPYLKVKVESIDGGLALVRDQFGANRTMSVVHRRGNGPVPRVGESWIIDRTLGYWSFSSVLTPLPPSVHGSTAGIPALASLLNVLESAGMLIADRTESGGLIEDSTSDWNTSWVTAGALQYRKIVSGLVLLRGSVGAGVVCTLPPQCRPSTTVHLAGIGPVLAGSNAGGPVVFVPNQALSLLLLTVDPGGVVTSAGSMTVDNCSFLAEP